MRIEMLGGSDWKTNGSKADARYQNAYREHSAAASPGHGPARSKFKAWSIRLPHLMTARAVYARQEEVSEETFT